MLQLVRMAAIDSLLRLILVRNAEVLILGSGEIPALRKAGAVETLSMPPLAAEIVAAMVREIVDAPAAERLGSSGSVEIVHRLADATAFAVLVEARGAGYRLACRPSAAPRPAPSAPPLRVVAPAPAPAPRSAPAPVVDEVAAPVATSDDALVPVLAHALELRASDLLLSEGQPPRARIAGELRVLDHPPVTRADILGLVGGALDDARRRELDVHGSADVPLATSGARFRVNVFRQRGGLAAALRPIRRDPPTLEALHLPADLYELTRYPSGLVLVTGRAGSGKSTTLAALIEQLDRTRARHVITLEDPVEYEYAARRCLIHQREVGVDVDSFAAGLRAALRESPDVILVGELRDRETIAAALTAAETGHLVLGTLHAAGAAGAVDRIIDVFPERQQQQVRLQLAMTLRAVLAQVLVPGQIPPARYPAHELMVVTTAIASQIRDGKLHQIASSIQTGRDSGMVPLERSLAALVRAGNVSRAAAREVALDPAALDDLLRR